MFVLGDCSSKSTSRQSTQNTELKLKLGEASLMMRVGYEIKWKWMSLSQESEKKKSLQSRDLARVKRGDPYNLLVILRNDNDEHRIRIECPVSAIIFYLW